MPTLAWARRPSGCFSVVKNAQGYCRPVIAGKIPKASGQNHSNQGQPHVPRFRTCRSRVDPHLARQGDRTTRRGRLRSNQTRRHDHPCRCRGTAHGGEGRRRTAEGGGVPGDQGYGRLGRRVGHRRRQKGLGVGGKGPSRGAEGQACNGRRRLARLAGSQPRRQIPRRGAAEKVAGRRAEAALEGR